MTAPFCSDVASILHGRKRPAGRLHPHFTEIRARNHFKRPEGHSEEDMGWDA